MLPFGDRVDRVGPCGRCVPHVSHGPYTLHTNGGHSVAVLTKFMSKSSKKTKTFSVCVVHVMLGDLTWLFGISWIKVHCEIGVSRFGAVQIGFRSGAFGLSVSLNKFCLVGVCLLWPELSLRSRVVMSFWL